MRKTSNELEMQIMIHNERKQIRIAPNTINTDDCEPTFYAQHVPHAGHD